MPQPLDVVDSPGTGNSLIRDYVGKMLMLKRIKAGSNVTLTVDKDSITIASSGGGGGGGNTYFPSGW